MSRHPDPLRATVIVPTFNEAPNVAPLVARIAAALEGVHAEVLFVDDSTDDTPDRVREVALTAPLPVRLIHRTEATGGLSGAVIAGLEDSTAEVCIVMDGDLQHPPELMPHLLDRYAEDGVDVVVASRYVREGSSTGLDGAGRGLVSRGTTALTKAMFPLRLQGCTDPMTGFFLVRRSSVNTAVLHPRGFKILLEILARHQLTIREVPMRFAARNAGVSKASLTQGAQFLAQLTALRFGKMSSFAVVGAVGALLNLLIVWVLTQSGMAYLPAAVIAAEVTIIGNFLLIERFVFRDLIDQARGRAGRFWRSFLFNNAEAVIRIPIGGWMVADLHLSSVVATAITLVVAFVARYAFHALVVYAPKR